MPVLATSETVNVNKIYTKNCGRIATYFCSGCVDYLQKLYLELKSTHLKFRGIAKLLIIVLNAGNESLTLETITGF